jgi:hypothetical protein
MAMVFIMADTTGETIGMAAIAGDEMEMGDIIKFCNSTCVKELAR